MLVSPTALDSWIADLIARFWGLSETFDLFVEKGIEYGLFGGIWFALAIFLLWVGAGEGTEEQEEVRKRLLTTLAGTVIAAVLIFAARALIHWQPPNCAPGLAERFPGYLDANPNASSFPSESTAIYTAIAAGIFSIRRRMGTLLWLAVFSTGALPRMYVGGHYLTDVIAGLAIGTFSFWVARRLLEERLVVPVGEWEQKSKERASLIQIVVFLWILQIATSFQLAFWIVDR